MKTILTNNPVDNIKINHIGNTQPSSPWDGMMWVDTSTSPPILKCYYNSQWNIINNGVGLSKATIHVNDFYFDTDYSGADIFVYRGAPMVGFTNVADGLVYSYIYEFVPGVSYDVKALYVLNGSSSSGTPSVVIRIDIEGLAINSDSFSLISSNQYTISSSSYGKVLLYTFTNSSISSSHTINYIMFKLSFYRLASSSSDTYGGVFNLLSILLVPSN